MSSAFSSGLGARFGAALRAVLALAVLFCLPFPAAAQDNMANQGGISTPMLSRCAGKFGAELRAGDEAFPLMGLAGVPWLNIERTSQTVNGAHVVAIVTGIGARNRRRGQVVPLRFRCLIDDKGDAVSFTWNDLLPERNEYLPPAMMLHGTAYYEPRHELPPGAELRVQLFDQAANPPALLTESVVRSSWVEPIPYALRLPHDMKLQDRKLVIEARLSLGSQVLYRLKQPPALAPDQLQNPIDLTLTPVVGSSVQ
jgi:uncharacterized lipoprotein YbaY